MKISVKWLNEFFLELPDAKKPLENAQMLREKLPFIGLEIGAVLRPGDGLKGVVVGQILHAEKHPKADRLQVCKVDVGAGEPLQIVCGAPNARKDLRVAVATVGTVLPGDFAIKAAKVRDVDSFGMLCSRKELGMAETGPDGILELPATAPVGTMLVKALGLNDEIWDVEVTPDRTDCLSHLGIAREVGRLLEKRPTVPEHESLTAGGTGDVPLISVEIQAKDGCPIYGAQLFEGITQTQSPDWMVRTLEALGHRSHNALVDVTNYVLQEMGHPLHAFDADKIAGSKLLVRWARKGEKLVTLDDVERTLTDKDLVIADIEKPLALAGVMGGKDSGVSASTTRLVLEAALFDAQVIRGMAQRHRIHSEASHRFERGVDAGNILRSAGRAALLLKKLSGARRRGSYVELSSDEGKRRRQALSVNFDLRAFKNVVGMEASAEILVKHFASLCIETQAKSPNVLRVDVPTYRLDLQREVDLMEESARLLGYEKIPERYPVQARRNESKTLPLFKRIQRLRRRLSECGLCEMQPYSFVSERELAQVPQVQAVKLENPLSAQWSAMRPNLLFGLLETVTRHVALGQLQGSFFDVGAAFTNTPSKAEDPYNPGVTESLHAAWALMGRRMDEQWFNDKTSEDRKKPIDFYDAKGCFDRLLPDLALFEGRWGGARFVPLSDFLAQPEGVSALREVAPWIPLALLHPGRSALIVFPGKPPGTPVGYVGELHPRLKSDWLNLPTGLQLGVAVGELRVVDDLLLQMQQLRSGESFAALQPYGKIHVSRRLPTVERDLALAFPVGTPAGDIESSIRKAAGPLLLDLKCLDLFVLPDGRPSLAYRMYLQGQDKTLSDEEIVACLKTVQKTLQEKHQGEIRA